MVVGRPEAQQLKDAILQRLHFRRNELKALSNRLGSQTAADIDSNPMEQPDMLMAFSGPRGGGKSVLLAELAVDLMWSVDAAGLAQEVSSMLELLLGLPTLTVVRSYRALAGWHQNGARPNPTILESQLSLTHPSHASLVLS